MKSRSVYGGCILIQLGFIVMAGLAAGSADGSRNSSSDQQFRDFRDYVSPCRQLLQGDVPMGTDKEGRPVPLGVPEDKLALIESEAIKLQALLDNALRVIENQEDALTRNILTAAMGQNHLIVGDPGAAKTMLINWQFGGLDLWSIPMNPWTTVDEIIGGISKEDFDSGRASRRNVEGSALGAEYTLFDEFGNANPTTRSSVLSLANPGERYIMIEGRPFYAKTRAMFATGNASFFEILQSFDEEGKAGQGQASLNRFAFKTTLSAWLSLQAQERRDENLRRQNLLKHKMKYGTPQQKLEAKEEYKSYQPTDFNYHVLDYLSEQAFIMDPLAENAARTLVGNLKTEMDRAVYTSYKEGRENQDPSFVPFESATEWSERIRTLVPQLIKTSAAIDLMRLPKGLRTRLLKNGPITLTTASLWRLRYLIRGAPGYALFDPKTAQIHFNLKREHETLQNHDGRNRIKTRSFYYVPTDVREFAQNARTTRNKADWEHMLKEQEMFNRLIQAPLEEAVKIHQLLAAVPRIDGREDDGDDLKFGSEDKFSSKDFESLVYRMDQHLIDRLRPPASAPAAATPPAGAKAPPAKP